MGGSSWNFDISSRGFEDGGIDPTTNTSSAKLNQPYRLALAEDRGILYISDMNNGAIRRVYIGGQCRCPPGHIFVKSAQSCYNPTPSSPSSGAIIKCSGEGQFA